MATSKKPGTAVVKWEEQMAQAAKKQQKTEKLTGMKTISFKGGRISVDKVSVKGDELKSIILFGIHENQFFSQDYDPDQFIPPDCFAFSDPKMADEDPDAIEDAMAPVAKDVIDQQSAKCVDCPLNVMGSAEKGQGKACKNVRRVAVLPADALKNGAQGILDADMRMAKIPLMSTRNYGAFVHACANDYARPTFGVVATIATVPDDKSQFRVTFEVDELITFNQEMWDAVQKRVEEAKKALIVPYPKEVAQAERPAARGKGKPARKVIPVKKAVVPKGMPKGGGKVAPRAGKY